MLLLYVLLMFLIVPRNMADQRTCGDVLENRIILGNTTERVMMSYNGNGTEEKCCLKCLQNEDCQAWVLHGRICDLKSSVDGTEIDYFTFSSQINIVTTTTPMTTTPNITESLTNATATPTPETIGPNKWIECYSNCGGPRQSPINILPRSAVYKSFQPFTFTNYDLAPAELNIANNGHTAQIKFPRTADSPYISGGGLPDVYRLAQVHFHWSQHGQAGGEHDVDGREFAVEMHLVHFKNSSDNATELLSMSDGLAVLGVHLQEGTANKQLPKVLFDDLQSVYAYKATKSVEPFAPISLLPNNTARFYRYNGSLTTPPCSEAVIWTVFEELMSISESDRGMLKNIQDRHGETHERNYREVQPVGDRQVESSFHVPTQEPAPVFRYVGQDALPPEGMVIHT